MAAGVEVRGRSVAVVGRASSSLGSREGARIDASDVVIRVNAVLPLDPEEFPPVDFGERTDLVYCSIHHQKAPEAAKLTGVPFRRVSSSFRKGLAFEAKGLRPFTGTVAIFQALQDGARDVFATGMDLYLGSKSQGGPGGGLQWSNWRHDPALDARLLRRLALHNHRFRPSRALEAQL